MKSLFFLYWKTEFSDRFTKREVIAVGVCQQICFFDIKMSWTIDQIGICLNSNDFSNVKDNKKVEDLETENEKLMMEVQDLRTRRDNLQAENSTLRTELGEARKSAEDWEENCKSLEQTKKILEADIQAAEDTKNEVLESLPDEKAEYITEFLKSEAFARASLVASQNTVEETLY